MKCLSCKKNEAVMSRDYGYLDCQECRDRMRGEKSTYGKKVNFESDGQYYKAGESTKFISDQQLRHIKSGVMTHEGQYLSGKEGRKYMDRYSRECLGKDLSGTYNSRNIG